jgi:hypothetical protein
MGKDLKDFQEEMNEEELELYKQKIKTMEWLWGPEETRTILGLLKGRKMKKELEEHLKKNRIKNG